MFQYSKGLIEKIQINKLPLDYFLVYSSTQIMTNYTTPNNAFNYERKDLRFETQDANHFLRFGFKNMSITLSAYKITSGNLERASHLKTWHIYGSNDDVKWELIHYMESDKLNGSLRSAVYKISEPKGPYKYYKLCNVTTFYIQEKILIGDFDVYDTIFSPLFMKRVTIERDIYSDIRHFSMFVITTLL